MFVVTFQHESKSIFSLFQTYGRHGATKVIVAISDDDSVSSSQMASYIATAENNGRKPR